MMQNATALDDSFLEKVVRELKAELARLRKQYKDQDSV